MKLYLRELKGKLVAAGARGKISTWWIDQDNKAPTVCWGHNSGSSSFLLGVVSHTFVKDILSWVIGISLRSNIDTLLSNLNDSCAAITLRRGSSFTVFSELCTDMQIVGRHAVRDNLTRCHYTHHFYRCWIHNYFVLYVIYNVSLAWLRRALYVILRKIYHSPVITVEKFTIIPCSMR